MPIASYIPQNQHRFGKQELKDLQAFAATKGFEGKLMPWDTTFYAGLTSSAVGSALTS